MRKWLTWFGMAALVALNATPGFADCGAKIGQFKVFDGTAFLNKPTDLGMLPIHIIDRGLWLNEAARRGAPDLNKIRAYLASLPDDDAPIVLDIEQYAQTGDSATVANSVAELGAMASAFKRSTTRQIGFYGVLPIPDYKRASGTPDTQAAWKLDDDRSAALAEKIDVTFPVLYTAFNEPERWVKFAIASICEARRLTHKPVYVFLWPEYHPANPALAGTPIDGAFWQAQVATARRWADGIVIWGGWDLKASKRLPWDANAPWWAILKPVVRQSR